MKKLINWSSRKIIAIKNWARFIKEFLVFQRLTNASSSRFDLLWSDRYPCLHDRTLVTGFDRHYVYHTAWAARVISYTRPNAHVDISSSLYFAGIVSAFCPVKFYDYRPADLCLTDFESQTVDLQKLPFSDNSIRSLSCMHVVEHIGLGRYGDPLDPDGDLNAILELKRVLAPGGTLLFVVPIGRPRVMFNAHRIYSHKQVRDLFSDLLLRQFALIPDRAEEGGLITDATENMADAQHYGCGCFWFEKGC